MKYLNKKFIMDIKSLWPQFLSVVIMAMISVTIYSGMSSVWTGMGQSLSEYEKNTNLADAFIYGMNIKEDEVSKIRNLNYVTTAEESMLNRVEVIDIDNESDLYLNTFSNDTLNVMKPVIRDGIGFSEHKNGIWIDEDYAKANSLRVGDKIKIKSNSYEKEIEILGIVLHSENIYFTTSSLESVPDHIHHGYGYLNEQYSKDIFGNIQYNQVRLKIEENSIVTKNELQKDMKNILKNSFYSSVLKDDKISITMVKDEQEQIQKMAILFSVVFILLSILSMYTTMSRIVNNQVVQIGTMKSLGFFDRDIYFHYGLYGFLVSVLGSTVGLILGLNVVAKLVMGIKQSTLTLPTWRLVIGMDTILLILSIIAICTFSSVLTVRKVVKTVPALSIHGLTKGKKMSTKTYKRSKLSYDFLWTIRGMKAHPIRFIMGIIAIIGSVVLMVAGVGVWDSLLSSYDSVFDNQYRYKYVGNVGMVPYEKIADDFRDNNVQLAQVESATFRFNDEEKDGVISVLGEGEQIKLFDHEKGKSISLFDNNKEVVMTYKIAESIGIREGDMISYTKNNSSKANYVRIDAIVDAKLPQGIFVSSNCTNDFTPNTIYLGDEKACKVAKGTQYINGVISIEEQRDNMNQMMDSVHSIMYILILASFILSSVILYNLGILSFIERYREYATMRVLGFYRKEIVAMVIKECCINLFIGLAIGIPLSIKFLGLYVNIVSLDNMEWTPYITKIHFFSIVGIVTVFSILISLLVCMKIRKVDMVEALKSTE